METRDVTAHIVRFGAFEVDMRTGELRKRGLRIALQDQPLKILTALLAADGDIVTRGQLCALLWPGGTFVDFEHSLNAAVRRLRVALGDVADVPRFVETVPRRGYRFLVIRSGRTARVESPDRMRLAVIPFTTVTATDPGANIVTTTFVEGLVDETITQLARACPRRVGVIARTSIAQLLAAQRNAGEIGRAVGAGYLLEGCVRRDGDRVRITAQLIDAEEQTHRWAASYDRTLADALTVQTEVAEAIASAVVHQLVISPSENDAGKASRVSELAENWKSAPAWRPARVVSSRS